MNRNSVVLGRMLRIAVAIAGLVVVGGASSSAIAGDFMDTRLTWTFGDDDFMKDAGEKIPDSPGPGIGDRKGYELFFNPPIIRLRIWLVMPPHNLRASHQRS